MMERALVATVLLAGCAATSPGQWVNANGTPHGLAEDRWACAQQSTVPYVEGYRAGQRLDPALFRLCMEARGYTLQRQPR